MPLIASTIGTVQKIWDSGIGLSSWTAGLKESNAVPESESGEGMTKLVSVLFSDSPCKIVELGLLSVSAFLQNRRGGNLT